jgi:hypothetical protein
MRLGRPVRRAATMVAALGLIGSFVSAQEHAGTEAGAEEAHAAHGAAEAHETHGEEHPRNALGIVLGGTYESEEKDTFFTIGVEYERLFNPSFAVVLGVEYITEVDAVVAVLPFVYRHKSGWRLLTGPGLELKTRRPHLEGEPEGGHGIAEDNEDRLPGKEEDLFLF